MNDQPQSRSLAERIEDRVDKGRVGQVALSDRAGGLAFANLAEVMEAAKLMSIAGAAVPPHLRNKPGECLAICIQAFEWRMSPFAVANKSYVVNDRLSFESQLIHAVIEQRAPLKGRLRHEYSGEGDSLTCKVWGTAINEDEPLVFVSSPISKITPKNSPLWKTKPALQLYYNASRDWCRMYFPDVVLGVYSRDEIEDHMGPERARDVTPPRVVKTMSEKLDAISEAGADPETGEITIKGIGDPPSDSPVAAAPEAGTPSSVEGAAGRSADPLDWSLEACEAHGREQRAADVTRKAVVPPELRAQQFGEMAAAVLAGWDSAVEEKEVAA